MSSLYVRPDWVRRLNKFGPAVGDAALVVPLDPDELLRMARESTGLSYVGDEDWISQTKEIPLDETKSCRLILKDGHVYLTEESNCIFGPTLENGNDQTD